MITGLPEGPIGVVLYVLTIVVIGFSLFGLMNLAAWAHMHFRRWQLDRYERERDDAGL